MMKELIDQILKIGAILERVKGMIFFIKNISGKYMFVTSSFSKFVGLPFNKIIYQHGETVFKNGNLIKIKKLLAEDSLMVAGDLELTDQVLKLKDWKGDCKHMKVIKIPLYDDEENIIGILGAGIDVSKDKNERMFLHRVLMNILSPQERAYINQLADGVLETRIIARNLDTREESIYTCKSDIKNKLKCSDKDLEFLVKICRDIKLTND